MAKSPMDDIKQTGKTIIFEEFDNTKPDLKTILDSVGDDPQSFAVEDFFANVRKDLEIKTFDEFVDKFAPTFYQIVNRKEDGSPSFSYTTKEPNFKCGVISLKNTDFMKAILNLIKDKEVGGKSNNNSNYDDFRKQLSPKAVVDRIMSVRKSIEYNMKKAFELIEEKKLPMQNAEVQKYKRLALDDFNNAVKLYSKDPFLPMLTLRIADLDNSIQLLSDKKDSKRTSDGIAIGYEPSFDENGSITLIEHKISDKASLTIDNAQSNCALTIVQTLNKDLDANAPESVKTNNFLRELIIKAFGPAEVSIQSNKNIEDLKKEKKQYLDIYNDYTENLINSIIPAVEKFVGVKEFFEHAATADGSLANDVSVIISNCKADAIVNDPKTIKNFRRFFVEGIGETTTSEHKIWFAVIPAVALSEKDKTKSENSNFQRGGFWEDVEINSDNDKESNDLVSLNATKKMIEVLRDASIMTFFNFKASEETSFSKLTKNTVNKYKKLLENFDNEYAVFSYPNFTILPKNKNSIEIGTTIDEVNTEHIVYINLNDGVYLDSSYVAAGMTVGTQNYDIMKDKFSKINRDYPFVRFDFEAGKNAELFTTKLNRESEFGMEKSAKDSIYSDRFGFVFCDNRMKNINNCYVINSRTLKKDGNNYRSIYQVLVSNFVYHLISINGAPTETNIKEFKINYSDEWESDNNFDRRKYDNRIFMDNERLDISNISNGEIGITFENDEKVQTNLKIKVNKN